MREVTSKLLTTLNWSLALAGLIAVFILGEFYRGTWGEGKGNLALALTTGVLLVPFLARWLALRGSRSAATLALHLGAAAGILFLFWWTSPSQMLNRSIDRFYTTVANRDRFLIDQRFARGQEVGEDKPLDDARFRDVAARFSVEISARKLEMEAAELRSAKTSESEVTHWTFGGFVVLALILRGLVAYRLARYVGTEGS